MFRAILQSSAIDGDRFTLCTSLVSISRIACVSSIDFGEMLIMATKSSTGTTDGLQISPDIKFY